VGGLGAHQSGWTRLVRVGIALGPPPALVVLSQKKKLTVRENN
jgi:hypothetical protein